MLFLPETPVTSRAPNHHACFHPLRTLGGNGTLPAMADKFERHRQPWRQDEIQKLHLLAGKGMSQRAIAKALTRSEESVKDRARADGLKIAKLR